MSTKKIARPFQPLEKKKHFEKIVDLLKQQVFSGEFHPGDRLPAERDLADMLRVSVLSVREAYRALELFGMLEIRRGNEGGTFIRRPSRRSIVQSVSDLLRFQGITFEEWNEARLLLELDIGRLAIKRSGSADFSRLEGLIAEASQKIRASVPPHEEHIRFHMAFAELAHNPILFTAYNSMMDLLLSSLLFAGAPLKHSEAAVMAHLRMLNTLKGGDFSRLAPVIEDHVKEAGERLVEIARGVLLFTRTAPEAPLSPRP